MICRNNRWLFLHHLEDTRFWQWFWQLFGEPRGHHYEHGTLLRFAFVFPPSASGSVVVSIAADGVFNLGLARKNGPRPRPAANLSNSRHPSSWAHTDKTAWQQARLTLSARTASLLQESLIQDLVSLCTPLTNIRISRDSAPPLSVGGGRSRGCFRRRRPGFSICWSRLSLF